MGGIDGGKIKVPTVCNTLISLQPVSLTGGEQTLYAVTADGKVDEYIYIQVYQQFFCIYNTMSLQVYSTGYGAGGRLGIGSSDSISLPTLLESIRHVHITKVNIVKYFLSTNLLM